MVMKKRKLKRVDFDDYIWDCYVEYRDKNQDYQDPYFAEITRNRNPEQVPEILWQKLLFAHLNNNYN